MSTIGAAVPGTAWFLEGIANVQQQQAETVRQLSSGYQVQTAADAPSLVPDLVNFSSSLSATQDYQTRLGQARTEAQAADSALATGISLLENAQTLATQGADSSSTAATRQTLAAEVQGIQQQMVGLANTAVAGRYIFGGSSDRSAPYAYDGSNSRGADRLTPQAPGPATVNTQGQTAYQGLTASQIFDLSDSSGNPVAGNVFSALQSLSAALTANDTAGISAALNGLQAASNHLNQQQAVYGAAEQRISEEQNTASNQVTAIQTAIGGIRDANVTQDATNLSQEVVEQSAAYGAQSLIPKKSLFDYLG